MSETCSPRSSHSSASRSSSRSPILSVASSISNTTRPVRSGGLKAKPRPLLSRGSRVDALHLVEPLRARLRLAGARAGAEARDEALEALDLRLLALDGPAERELARRLLLAPGVPRAGEELRAAGLELEHRGSHRLEEPAVVSHQHDGRVQPGRRCSSHSSESMSRWLVGSSRSSRSGSPASARASDPRVSSPPENVRELAVEVGVTEAEAADDA